MIPTSSPPRNANTLNSLASSPTFGLLPSRLDRLVVSEALDHLGPGATRRAGRRPGVDPRSSGSSELILGLIKGLPVPLHGVPVDGQGLPGLMLGVEGVQGRVQGVLTLPAALLLGLGDPRLQGLLRIGDHVLQGVSSPQLLGPDRAPQYADLLPREPDNASRFNAHEHGTAVEEDLIEATDQHQGLALGVQPCSDGPWIEPGPPGTEPPVVRGRPPSLPAQSRRGQEGRPQALLTARVVSTREMRTMSQRTGGGQCPTF